MGKEKANKITFVLIAVASSAIAMNIQKVTRMKSSETA